MHISNSVTSDCVHSFQGCHNWDIYLLLPTMAKLITSFLRCHNPMILVFIFLSALNFAFSQTPDVGCVIDIQASSSWRNSSCEAGNWGGFISNCCEVVFDDYLYALGQRANQTGKLFLNSTEQTTCLVLMKGIKEDVLSCGIEKLTSGAGSCSDYTKLDVFNNLRNTMESLEEDCKLLGTAEKSDQVCSVCLKRWEEIVASSDNERGSSKVEASICGFAVLVSLTSKRIDDKDFVQGLYECLGDQRLSAGKQYSPFFHLPLEGRQPDNQQRYLILFHVFFFIQ